MTALADRGFGPVLANRNFRALWAAQLLAQTSQHAIHFIQLVLIEQLTKSTVHTSFTILAFTIPGVLFSPVAGVVVDRLPKKWILVLSNLVRVLFALSYLLVLTRLGGTWRLLAIYAIAFLTATLAQFFSPAEASTIPLLVGERLLLPANSLFTITMVLSQVIGLMLLGPLAATFLGVQGGFILIAVLYLGAAISVSLLPTDRRPADTGEATLSGWRRLWRDMQEGWRFVSGQRKVQSAMVQLVTIATLVMIMASVATGYAARVLGMAPSSAIIVFAPAAIGMLVAMGVTGRWGHVLRRIGFAHWGLMLAGLGFLGLGWVSADYSRLLRPILSVYPNAAFSLTTATMVIGLVIGVCMASSNVLAQTTLQQESPANIRGRVFSVQFMLNNLMGIPPLLALGVLSDAIGIPRVLEIVGALAVVFALMSLVVQRLPTRQRTPNLT